MAAAGHNYVAAAQSAESAKAVADEVKRALADPTLFFYGALFSLTTTQKYLGESTVADENDLFQLLDIMAHGTVKDLTRSGLATSPVGPLLTPNLVDRLRELSVLSFCASAHGAEATLFYDPLIAFLELPDDEALERVLRSAISHRLLKARLDSQRRCVYVEDFTARCVRAKDVTALKLALKDWLRVIDGQLDNLEEAAALCHARHT